MHRPGSAPKGATPNAELEKLPKAAGAPQVTPGKGPGGRHDGADQAPQLGGGGGGAGTRYERWPTFVPTFNP